MKKISLIIVFVSIYSICFSQYYEDGSFRDSIRIPEDRNITAVGYQIGGFCLLGIDFEFRVHDFLGIHLGAGLQGYTAGIKIHTSPHRDSPFLNLSYKDGGFGLINTFGFEIGSRLVFNKRDNGRFGLHAQIGAGAITNISNEMSSLLYGNEEAPSVILTIGIGFSW